jgi:hypothetical protein
MIKLHNSEYSKYGHIGLEDKRHDTMMEADIATLMLQ